MDGVGLYPYHTIYKTSKCEISNQMGKSNHFELCGSRNCSLLYRTCGFVFFIKKY